MDNSPTTLRWLEDVHNAAAAARFEAPEDGDCDLTSMQPLGEARVLVCYDRYEDAVTVTGALIAGAFVEHNYFDSEVVDAWTHSIEIEERRARESDHDDGGY